MYNQSIKNQAVKEYVNGSTLQKTATKYGVSIGALRTWVVNYKQKMSIGVLEGDVGSEEVRENNVDAALKIKKKNHISIQMEQDGVKHVIPLADDNTRLESVNLNVDGHEVRISRKYVERLINVFQNFNKEEEGGKR